MTSAVNEKIEKALLSAKTLPSSSASERAMRDSAVELLEFCREGMIQIDVAIATNKPVRMDALIGAIHEIKKDSVLIETALSFSESEEVRTDFSDSIDAFTEYVSKSISRLPLFYPQVVNPHDFS